jgi:hypothetical protein
LIGTNHPRIQQLLNALTADLKVIGSHQLDLAQAVVYAGSAVSGFSSVASSASTPSNWVNVYANLLSVTSAYTVLGSCGLLDQVLDAALGPDPLPCSERTGPLPTASGSTVPSLGGASSTAGQGSSPTGRGAGASRSGSGSGSGSGGHAAVAPTLPGLPTGPAVGSNPASPLLSLLGPLTGLSLVGSGAGGAG